MADDNLCPICLDKFTTSVRKPVTCGQCRAATCSKCVEKYLLNTIEDPHCPHCRFAWPRSFLNTVCTSTFLNKTYYKYRQDILMNRERSFLPQMMVFADREMRARKVDSAAQDIYRDEIELRKEYEKKLVELAHKRTRLWQKAQSIRSGREDAEGGGAAGSPESKAETRKFVRRCTATDCKGFLSSVWKCGVCENWVCPDCFEVKGKNKDVVHTCKPEMLETANLIKKDTKPCPSCGEMIMKSEGCFAADTPVLMYNGTTILSQNIKVGDQLIGDDGEVRIVERIMSGVDEMYEVTQTNGLTYTVNSKHKLALKLSGDRVITWRESENAWFMAWFDHDTQKKRTRKVHTSDAFTKQMAYDEISAFRTSISYPEVIEITVDDYIKLSDTLKKELMGFKSNGVNWHHVETKLDPYLLGLYIGDGINDGQSIAICADKDPEIVRYLLDWCEKNNSELCHDAAYKFRIRGRDMGHTRMAIEHGATSATCKGCTEKKCEMCDLPNKPYTDEIEITKNNQYTSALRHYNLIRNKHIPIDYIINDRETRLQVLAGIIDTDGYVCNDGKRVMISQANHNIAKQIEIIARSLGFTVNTRMIKKHNISFNGIDKKDYADHYAINISATDLNEIPCLIERKKCTPTTPNKNWLNTGITVKHIGTGTYYGWSVTGGTNKRFILEDFTVVRNCDQMWCTSCHTPFSWATGKVVTTGIIHNPHYYQWMRNGGGGQMPQHPGFIPCGGLPDPYNLRRSLRHVSEVDLTEFLAIYRTCVHMIEVERTRYERHVQPQNNRDLDVRYLMNELDEEDWKSALARDEKDRQKSKEIREILDAFNGATIDIMRRIEIRPANPYDRREGLALILEIRTELNALREYIVGELMKVSKAFNCSVPYIDDDWDVRHGSVTTIKRNARAAAKEAADETAVVPTLAPARGGAGAPLDG